MSHKLRTLSGTDVIRILGRFGFEIHSQRGSHVKLARKVEGKRQVLTIPTHSELDRGTAHAIFRQASRYIPDEELRSHFYTQK